MKLARPPIPPKKRAARAEVRQQADKLRRLALSQTSKQNNFQFLLRKIWRAGVKKLKENCFALLAEVRRAETRSGANQTFSVQKRFEQRSVIGRGTRTRTETKSSQRTRATIALYPV